MIVYKHLMQIYVYIRLLTPLPLVCKDDMLSKDTHVSDQMDECKKWCNIMYPGVNVKYYVDLQHTDTFELILNNIKEKDVVLIYDLNKFYEDNMKAMEYISDILEKGANWTWIHYRSKVTEIDGKRKNRFERETKDKKRKIIRKKGVDTKRSSFNLDTLVDEIDNMCGVNYGRIAQDLNNKGFRYKGTMLTGKDIKAISKNMRFKKLNK